MHVNRGIGSDEPKGWLMPLRTILIVSMCLTAALAFAEPVMMDGPAIRDALSGKIVAGDQNGRKWRQVFHAGGATEYSETNGRPSSPSQGGWRVQGDRYCSVWPPSDVWACYDMAMDGEEILFIESNGTEWRARFVDE